MGTTITIPSSVDENGDIVVLAVAEDNVGDKEKILIKAS